MKFHATHRVLIRRSIFCDLDRAAGVWLDYLNSNCRVTGNLFQTDMGSGKVRTTTNAVALRYLW